MMHAAAEYRATGVFMGGVAEDFAGNQGIDRDALLGLMRFHFLRNEKVSIVLGPISVEIQGDRATAQFELVLLGGNQALLPERARALDVKTGWRDVDGEWFVYYAEWKPVF